MMQSHSSEGISKGVEGMSVFDELLSSATEYPKTTVAKRSDAIHSSIIIHTTACYVPLIQHPVDMF